MATTLNLRSRLSTFPLTPTIDPEPQPEVDTSGLDQCAWVRADGGQCTNYLPAGHHNKQLYCDGHKRGGALRKAETGRSDGKIGDTAPINVNVKVGGGSRTGFDASQKKVAEAATAWLSDSPPASSR